MLKTRNSVRKVTTVTRSCYSTEQNCPHTASTWVWGKERCEESEERWEEGVKGLGRYFWGRVGVQDSIQPVTKCETTGATIYKPDQQVVRLAVTETGP